MTQTFFLERKNLRRVFVLIDGNIPPQKIDLEFMQTLADENILFDIIVTKIDKSNQKELNANALQLKNALQNTLHKIPKIFLSSSNKKI